MLNNKTVIIGITGGIAAYKACDAVSSLVKNGAKVKVIMTKNATEFIRPLTLETLSNNEVITDMFIRTKEWEIEHISLAKEADIFVIVPATANIIGKIASGIADDMLTTTFMAYKGPKVICPAMNSAMYADSRLLENISKLKESGITIIEPAVGRLACGDIGRGKLADIDQIINTIIDIIMPKRDYINKTVLITAGATEENIDSVRFISNHSSGKMGIELARAAINRGAKVILITGRITVELPKGIIRHIKVISTLDMFKAVMENYLEADIIIKAAAPADYTIKPNSEKIKSSTLSLELIKTQDIAMELGKVKGNRKLIIFSAETNDLIKHAKAKLIKKNADMVIANDVTQEGAGFNTDTNIVTIINKDGKAHSYDKMLKSELSDIILDRINQL